MNIMKTQIKLKSKQKPHNRTQNKANDLLCNIVLVQKQTNKNKMKQYTTHKTNTLLLSNALSVQNKTKTTKQNTKQSKWLVMQHCVGSKTNKQKQNETVHNTQNKYIVVKQCFVSSKQNKNHKTEHKTKQITCYATLCWFKNKQTKWNVHNTKQKHCC